MFYKQVLVSKILLRERLGYPWFNMCSGNREFLNKLLSTSSV